MNTFYADLISKLGRENFEKVQKARIGIAGAGGLGSNLAMNLVRTGFRYLTIIDFDVIDSANLDRQFYFQDQVGTLKAEALATNLRRINTDIALEMHVKKIGPLESKELFLKCDVVAECLDRAEYKSMLVSDLIACGKYIVAVSGLGGIGSSDDIKIHRVKKNLVMIGDLRSDISERPALCPRVCIAAAKQADVILEHVVNEK